MADIQPHLRGAEARRFGGADQTPDPAIPPASAEKVITGGWVDIAAVARLLRIDEAKVRGDWEPIARTLK